MELTYNGGNIAEEMVKMFNDCTESYNATIEGCEKIVETWKRNKGDRFDELFKNIPGYNAEQHCIVLDKDIYRAFDGETITDFFEYLYPLIDCREKPKYNGKDYNEWRILAQKYTSILTEINNLPATVLNVHGVEQIKAERAVALKAYNALYFEPEYISETLEEYGKRTALFNILKDYHDQYIDAEVCEKINEVYPEMKAHAGKKTSKITRKFCEIAGVKDKSDDFERRYAQYADAINPIVLDETMIISWHPLDYLTQSNGNSWLSCHNIGFEDGDYGCYSSGTLSYMLDGSSLVIYVIDKRHVNDGAPYWTHSKIHRQMFHINNDGTTILQSRLYPDDQSDWGRNTDYASYRQYREIVEDVVATAFGLVNRWSNKRGTDACRTAISTDRGTHYRDYFYYDNVNVSYNSETEKKFNLCIGHRPICPSCGCEHGEDCCTDSECWDNCRHECYECGERRGEDYMHYIDGRWYCENCCTYCEYHNQWEVGNEDEFTYVSDYGRVCAEGLDELCDNGEIVKCECCGDWELSNYAISVKEVETGDEHYFCTSNCRNYWLSSHSNNGIEYEMA